jgi:hypothetical protein
MTTSFNRDVAVEIAKDAVALTELGVGSLAYFRAYVLYYYGKEWLDLGTWLYREFKFQ